MSCNKNSTRSNSKSFYTVSHNFSYSSTWKQLGFKWWWSVSRYVYGNLNFQLQKMYMAVADPWGKPGEKGGGTIFGLPCLLFLISFSFFFFNQSKEGQRPRTSLLDSFYSILFLWPKKDQQWCTKVKSELEDQNKNLYSKNLAGLTSEKSSLPLILLKVFIVMVVFVNWVYQVS